MQGVTLVLVKLQTPLIKVNNYRSIYKLESWIEQIFQQGPFCYTNEASDRLLDYLYIPKR